jgi:hypothetical protein
MPVGDSASTSQSNFQDVASSKLGPTPHKDIPKLVHLFGKKKQRDVSVECPKLERKMAGPIASITSSFEANIGNECKPQSEAMRAFAGKIQGFCNQLLNSPMCKKA